MTELSRIRTLAKSCMPSSLYRSQRIRPRHMSQVNGRNGHRDDSQNRAQQLSNQALRDECKFYNCIDSVLDQTFAGIEVYQGKPEVKVLKDVWYFPEHLALFSVDGTRIDESCFRHGPERAVWPKHPTRIVPPKHVNRIAQRMVYVGWPFYKQYGHFLTESIARLWYALEDQSVPLLCQDPYIKLPLKQSFIDLFLSHTSLDRRRFFSFTTPVLLEEVVLPAPTMMNRFLAFKRHRELPEEVASRSLLKPPKSTSQPLYFSRRQLAGDRRAIIGEDRLEAILVENGFAICHPQTLSLWDQIKLVNQHEVFVGAFGSAFLNILFDLSSKSQAVYFVEQEAIDTDFVILGAIKDAESVFIGSIRRDDECTKNLSRRNAILDVDVTVESLRDLGLISA